MSVQAITSALAVRGVTASEKLLLLVLANYADEHMQCYPSQVRLASDTSLTDRTLRTVFKALEERRLLSRQVRRRPDGSRATDLVTLHLVDQPETASACSDQPEIISPPPEIHVATNRKSTADQPERISALTSFEPSVNRQRERESAGDASARLFDVRQAAGDALGDLARCAGITSLHALVALTSESPPCLWREDVLPAIESAAAWHRSRDGPGSMTTWTAAVRMARRNRDQRLNPPPAKVYPLERPHDSKQSANLSAAQRGAELASQFRAGRGTSN